MALFDTLNRYKNGGSPGLGASTDQIVSSLSLPEINELKYLQQNSNAAATSGISFDQLGRLLMALERQQAPKTPIPGETNVAQDLVRAALQQIRSPNAAPVAPQGIQGLMAQAPQQQPQMPPEGIQQAMAQPQMPPDAMDQGLGAIPAGVMGGEEVLSAAGGGIIAFAGDDEENAGSQLVAEPDAPPPEIPETVSAPTTSKEMYARLLAQEQRRLAGARVPTIGEETKSQRLAREEQGIKGSIGEERLKKLTSTDYSGRKDDAARDALAAAFFHFGKAASRTGSNRTGFLGAASEGAAAGLQQYIGAKKDIDALQRARDKEISDINNLQRAEQLGFAKDVRASIEKKQTNLANIENKIGDIEAKIAGHLATNEREAEKTKAANERARLDREARLQVAQINRQGTPLKISQIMQLPAFQRAYGKLSEAEQLDKAHQLTQTPEKTATTVSNRMINAGKKWWEVYNDPTNKPLKQAKATLANPKASEESKKAARDLINSTKAKVYRSFNVDVPSDDVPSSPVLQFDKDGNLIQ